LRKQTDGYSACQYREGVCLEHTTACVQDTSLIVRVTRRAEPEVVNFLLYFIDVDVDGRA